MSKRTNTEVSKIAGSPAFLAHYAEKADTSLAQVGEYRVLQRLKTVQSTARGDLKDVFGVGSIVAVPGRRKIADLGEAFLFVPIFFFVEYCKWKDYNDKSDGFAIVERTFDKGSELAARARDMERRFEPYPVGEGKGPKSQARPLLYRYVEHLNFAGLLYGGDHGLGDTPVTLSFSRGEFNVGKSLCSSAMLRRAKVEGVGEVKVPLWAQVWQFSSAKRTRDDNEWYGVDFSTPETSVITEEEAPVFEALHEALKADFERKLLVVDRSDEDGSDETAPAGKVDSEM